jgi:hydroxymethylpyrimidine/phosphomethylpyrimidine kinase
MKTVLTIAGSDPSGGAGVQGDLKTFAAHGVYGMAAITAVTVQNSLGVTRVHPLDAQLVRQQVESVLADVPPDMIKIGMLATGAIVRAVASVLALHPAIPVVIDPVMSATRGGVLLDDEGVAAFEGELLPLATVITPNAPEAERLTGLAVRTVTDARAAALRLVALGARAAIVTGGHLDDAGAGVVVDVLCDRPTGNETIDVAGPRVTSADLHGTGCAYASALAARLALGDGLVRAAQAAQRYVAEAMGRAPGIGRGRSPLGHA